MGSAKRGCFFSTQNTQNFGNGRRFAPTRKNGVHQVPTIPTVLRGKQFVGHYNSFLRKISLRDTNQKLILNPKVNGCTFELGKSKMGSKE